MAMWYYALGDKSYGPVSDDVIRSLATQGVLGPMASVLPEGSASWTPLHVHEMALGVRRTPGGDYVLAGALPGPAAPGWSAIPPPPPPPIYQPGIPYGSPYQAGPNYASWWQRVGAYLLDGLVLLVPAVILILVVARPEFDDSGSSLKVVYTGNQLLAQAITSLIALAYFGIMHSHPSGQTLGKRVVGIRVAEKESGRSLSFGKACLRYLFEALAGLWIVLALLGLLDILWPLWDSNKQALHDKVVGSVVIRV
jgi:uncharacterized RDD family membrane protein YckC